MSIFAGRNNQNKRMDALARTIENDKTHFAVLAIGATAKDMRISTQELYNRLKKLGLVKSLLLDCYDTLHSESIAGVVWNVEEALRNWEKEGGIN